jgi:peptide/nickel transport system permease protein
VVPLLIVVLIAIIGPFVVPFDPEKVVGGTALAPGGEFIFGTDSAGMDVFSRTVVATRTDLIIAVCVSLIATVLGMALGLLIGMNESSRAVQGILARGGARAMDLMEAVPAVLIGLVIIAFFGANVVTLILVLGITQVPIQSRLVRTEVLKVRRDAYLDAGRMAGMTELRLTLTHVLPNSIKPAWENAPVVFAIAIILTSALGFIGAGLPPPAPEWGSMISRGAADAATGRWWSAGIPALALAITVAAVSVAATFRTTKK